MGDATTENDTLDNALPMVHDTVTSAPEMASMIGDDTTSDTLDTAPKIQDDTLSHTHDNASKITDDTANHMLDNASLDDESLSMSMSSSDIDSLERQDSSEKNPAEAEIGLACPRCLFPFSDDRIPQIIPECQHVCCTTCLIQLTKWDANSTIECPRCEKSSKLPTGGTAAMDINEWLYKFVQQHHVGKLQEHLDDITHDLNGMHDDVQKSVAVLKELQEDTKEALKREDEQVDRCVEAVQAEAWVLKAQIRKIGEQRLKYLQEDIERMESRAHDIKTVHKITEASQENGNIQHIKYDELSSQMAKLLSVTLPPTNSVKSPQSARFLRENVTLGRVIKLRNLHLVYEFADRFQQLQDIVVTPNGLLCVCDSEGGAVTIYGKNEQDNNNQSRYTKHASLELNPSNPNQPTGVAATLDGKYIVARKTGVEVYSMAGAYMKTFVTTPSSTTKPKKSSKIQTNVCSLTTTEDGKILAGDIDRCVITIHDLTGDVVSTLPTPIKPRCIAPVWEKHLVAITDWQSGRLCVQHIGSGSTILNLDIPDALGVCYDHGAASLLVSRSERDHKTGKLRVGNGVIEQYNSSGDRTLIVCLTQDLYGACAMEFLGKDLLAVADSKAVKIYRVT